MQREQPCTRLRSDCGGGCHAMQGAIESANACASISFSAALLATLQHHIAVRLSIARPCYAFRCT